MRPWHKTLLGALLVGAVAVAGIALNFTLLRMTHDAHDPVGKLSPRAVFADPSRTTPAPTDTTDTTETTDDDDGSSSSGGDTRDDHGGGDGHDGDD